MDTLLVVDDEESILKSIQRVFMDDDSIKVITANSAKEAIQLLPQSHVDIIISDERMPQVSGTDFLRFVREKFPRIQRIILTGFASQEATINAINKAEVFRFLTKPWDPADLVATVKHALQIKGLRDQNEALLDRVKTQNQSLEKVNLALAKSNQDLERLVSERTEQLRKTMDLLKGQNSNLQAQRTNVVELLIALLGQYDGPKAKLSRQVWEALRLFAEKTNTRLSESIAFAAMVKVFVDPAYLKGDDTFLHIMESINGFAEIAGMIRESRENFDGTGPGRKAGTAISTDARLLRVVSDYFLLNPDQHAISKAYILNEMHTLYDPDLAMAFLSTTHDADSFNFTYAVAIDNLLPGMVICKDIALVNGSILLPAGSVLNETMIAQLKKVRRLVSQEIEIFSEMEKAQQ